MFAHEKLVYTVVHTIV